MIEEVKTHVPNIKRFGISFDINLDSFALMRDNDLKRYAIEQEAERVKESMIETLTKELIP